MLLLLLLLLRFLFMLPLFVLISEMLVLLPLVLLLLLPVMVHLVLLFGSNIRHPAVAGRERGTRDVMTASFFRLRWGRTLGATVGHHHPEEGV